MNRIASGLPNRALALLLLACGALPFWNPDRAGSARSLFGNEELQGQLPRLRENDTDPPSEDENLLCQQRARAALTFTIRELNEVHARLGAAMMPALPEPLKLEFVGNLASDNGRRRNRPRPPDRIHAIEWYVESDLVMFSFSISAQRTRQSITKLRIENRDIYLNIEYIGGLRGPDEKLPELGNQTVRSVMKLASRAPQQIEPARGAAADAELARQMEQEAGRITAREAQLIHYAFAAGVIHDVSETAQLINCGNLGHDIGGGNPQPLYLRPASDAIRWEVWDGEVLVFSFWPSTTETRQSIGRVWAESRELYINVDSVIGRPGPDDPIMAMGNRSIRSLVRQAAGQAIKERKRLKTQAQ
jgi:hypothetical protein